MSQRMLARYYLLPTIGRLSLCTVEWRIFVTRLFGDIFRLFQSCPYDYQNNGARICATGIVGILTYTSLVCLEYLTVFIIGLLPFQYCFILCNIWAHDGICWVCLCFTLCQCFVKVFFHDYSNVDIFLPAKFVGRVVELVQSSWVISLRNL